MTTIAQIKKLIAAERKRQQETLMLIPSENYTSAAVRRAVGSIFLHKYAEGYPGQRYYQGVEYADKLEKLAQEAFRRLFNVAAVNVQPYSGAVANAAIYLGLLKPGETLLGLDLNAGGHLSHGAAVNFSGRCFRAVHYHWRRQQFPWFDFRELAALVKRERPKLIVVGTTSFPRLLPWRRFSQLARLVNAYLLADISHLAGLIVAGAYPRPQPWVDLLMTTSQKTLRGPRGAVIMITKRGLRRDPQLPLKINRAVFPGLQGGPNLATIAGLALTALEAAQPAFRRYGQQVVKNARILAAELRQHGWRLITGGTDSHLILADVRPFALDGKKAASLLEAAGLITNANTIPGEPGSPRHPSGLRLGTPAVTTRGMGPAEMRLIAAWLEQILRHPGEEKLRRQIRRQVRQLCRRFPLDFRR